jgi:hypothetical protein
MSREWVLVVDLMPVDRMQCLAEHSTSVSQIEAACMLMLS